jgi:CMP-N-acetylneuraminic acid synthetase
VNHVLSSLDEHFDVVVLLQPTSPFRTSKHIDEAIKLMVEKNAESVVSVVKVNKSPEWMYWLDQKSMAISQILKGSVGNRRQESRPAYSLNGALYVIDVALFREINGFICPETVAYPMTETESLDIDTPEDFDFARFILAGKNRDL